MEVLQSLILDDGFPESLLRVSAAEIMSFMEPTKGLGEVMEKANFDVNAVKAKLQSVGANTLPSMSALFPPALPRDITLAHRRGLGRRSRLTT
jgi:hypothetical protein